VAKRQPIDKSQVKSDQVGSSRQQHLRPGIPFSSQQGMRFGLIEPITHKLTIAGNLS
jgi:hypothetical protein